MNNLSAVIKQAGYQWKKARVTLTGSDHRALEHRFSGDSYSIITHYASFEAGRSYQQFMQVPSLESRLKSRYGLSPTFYGQGFHNGNFNNAVGRDIGTGSFDVNKSEWFFQL